jgi:hypothetical protein
VSVGECKLIAIEGTNGTGKTTTSYALTAGLKQKYGLGSYCDESARLNPFVEDFTIYGVPLSMHIELHLLTKTIADQIMATRHNGLVVCDKTPVSLIGYTEVLLVNEQLPDSDRRLLEAMRGLLNEWCLAYDLVFFLRDRFDPLVIGSDPIRVKVTAMQNQVESAIETELRRMNVPFVDVPVGLSLESRAGWMVDASARALGLRSDLGGAANPRPGVSQGRTRRPQGLP